MSHQELIDIAHRISELLQKELDKRPYGANIIDELHAGENAHSRILRMLLQYSGGSKYPIYSQFLLLIQKRCQAQLDFLKCTSPNFVNEDGRIDLLIREYNLDNRFAIIIENKVCDAGDQDKQLERYVRKVLNEGVSPNRIIVVYLTKDGQKEVSEISLTEHVKTILGYNEDSEGRYIKLNYKHHIIPWLEQIIPEMPIKEELLIAALRQYLDYLKGICGERESEEPIYQKVRENMINFLGLQNTENYLQAYNDISLLQEQIKEAMQERMTELLEEHFYQPLKPLLNELFPGAYIKEKSCTAPVFYCRISVPNWQNTELIINPESNLLFGITRKYEDKDVPQRTRETLRVNLPHKGNNSPWWPWWKKLHMVIHSAETYGFLLDIENGTLFDFFSRWLKAVAIHTKELDM